jgi:hypothetical protein
MTLTAEQIEQNYNKFRSLCEKLGDRSEAALKFVDEMGERLALCPASSRKDYHLAEPGGLVDHSLRVLQNALTYSRGFGWSLPKDSLIIGCLFHDIGKLGVPSNDGNFVDYYIPQDSDWHREKLGEMYKYNKDMMHMKTPQRSVFLCQYYGLHLKTDEYLAILLNDGFVLDENKSYCLKEPLLAHVVMVADYISTRQEKGEFK